MSVSPGGRLGPYEIVAPLGAGGMGEVYRGRDTRLDRTVAIKVLPASLADDPEFRARFEREAKSISALNHPHICTLHDIGEAGGVMYLVMEHLEGETLADRLAKGALPVPEALALASQIANALDKAHRQGIVHRDLKPANVFLVRSLGAPGMPHCKLLDFGLAKTGVPVTSGSFETMLATSPPRGTNTPLTARGTILGTFQYMAPEQIEGEAADARADIWAFGCVLYEMLTARRAFDGKSQASLIASILERQPTPLAELQPLTPPALSRIVRTCLEKNPDNRFHTAHDLWLHLQWIEEGGSAAGLPAPVMAGRKRRARGIVVAALAGAALLGAAAAWWMKPAPVVPQPVGRFTLALPDGQIFTRTGRRHLAISPDGTKIAYVANRQIYLRRLEDVEAQPIPGTAVHPAEPTFSTDGSSLAFAAAPAGEDSMVNATIYRISIAGGAPLALTPAASPTGLRWMNGRILFITENAAVMSVADTGGTAEKLIEFSRDSGERVTQASIVRGDHLLYAVRPRSSQSDDAHIVVQPIAGGERRVLVRGGADPRVTSTGHLLWIHDNVLFAQTIDLKTLTLTGAPVPIVQRIEYAVNSGVGQYAVSDAGSLLYVPGQTETGADLVWVDRSGREEHLGLPADDYRLPRVSPDGTRIAVVMGQEQPDVGIWNIARRTMSKLTSGPENDSVPGWSADGRSIFYTSDGPGNNGTIYRRPADGTGSPTAISEPNTTYITEGLVPGADRLLVRTLRRKNVLAVMPITGGTAEPLFPAEMPAQQTARISPDGSWIAYQSSEGSMRDEVHVRPFPDIDTGHWQISSGGGTHPFWSPSGRELFFRTPAPRLTRVEVDPSSSRDFRYGAPAAVLDISKYRTAGTFAAQWDISPDGKRFLLVSLLRAAEENDPTPKMLLVTDWFEELKARVK